METPLILKKSNPNTRGIEGYYLEVANKKVSILCDKRVMNGLKGKAEVFIYYYRLGRDVNMAYEMSDYNFQKWLQANDIPYIFNPNNGFPRLEFPKPFFTIEDGQ